MIRERRDREEINCWIKVLIFIFFASHHKIQIEPTDGRWTILMMLFILIWRQQRAEKARHLEKIQLGEHPATNWVNWHQVCNMISYKRDVLERQSLSEVKMGRGSPICETVRKRIVEYFLKTMFLNVKLQRLCKSHHLQCITSSKDSEKLEKSLCVRDKGEDLCWMPMVFGPSDDTSSLIGMILSLTLNGTKNTSRNHFR